MDPGDLSAWNLNPSPAGAGGYPTNQPYPNNQGSSGNYPAPGYGYPSQPNANPAYPTSGYPQQPSDLAPSNYEFMPSWGLTQPAGPQAYPGGNAQTPFGMNTGPSYPQQAGMFGSRGPNPYGEPKQPTYPTGYDSGSFGMGTSCGYQSQAPFSYTGQGTGSDTFGGKGGGGGGSGFGGACFNSKSMYDVYAPSLKPYQHFNATQDSEKLRKAMKGLGTDEQAIIDIMGRRSVDQRKQIVLQFKTMYGKDLRKEFKSELSGHFHELVDALCLDATEFDASQLRKAVKGAGTDEEALVEILCTRTNEQIRNIKEKYSQLYAGRSLEGDVISDTSRHFQRLLVSMLQANRNESNQVNHMEAQKDAEDLYRAGEKRLGTDESTFNRILAAQSFSHLREVFKQYLNLSKNSIEKALKSEMSGDLLKAHIAIVRCIENKPKYFAHQLKKSMKGLGTRDRQLIRIVISRCEVDMEKVKEEFLRENGKTLQNWITDDTTGDYRKLLLNLVGN